MKSLWGVVAFEQSIISIGFSRSRYPNLRYREGWGTRVFLSGTV